VLRCKLVSASALAFAFYVSPANAQTTTAPGVTRTVLAATGGAVLGGLAGGIIGGATVSSQYCNGNNPDYCLGARFPRILWGMGGGITVGAPVGAWLGNGRRGKLVYDMLASGALFGGEILALKSLVHGNQTAHKSTVLGIVIAVPIAQIIASTIVERVTSP
jgi:hypothetical protein